MGLPNIVTSDSSFLFWDDFAPFLQASDFFDYKNVAWTPKQTRLAKLNLHPALSVFIFSFFLNIGFLEKKHVLFIIYSVFYLIIM